MTFRSAKLLRAAKGQSCVRCGKRDDTVVSCHYTGARRLAYGGGLGIKVGDIFTADLCGPCHFFMDSASRDKDGRWLHSEMFQHYILLTIQRRLDAGVVVVA